MATRRDAERAIEPDSMNHIPRELADALRRLQRTTDVPAALVAARIIDNHLADQEAARANGRPSEWQTVGYLPPDR
jgi:glutamine synthetase